MIVIQCTNCKRQLSIDDAFAGGVCRCQHCGTIQTVPAAGSATPAHSIDSTSGRSLYAQVPAAGTSGSGLDDLAGYVASSGLSSNRLTRKPKAERPPNLLPLWIGIGVAVLAVVVAAVVIMSRPATTTPGTAGGATAVGGGSSGGGVGTNSPATPAAVSGPNFNGVPLDGKTIIYCLDRGAATRDHFEEIKQEVAKSLATLGPDRKFEVVFWTDKSEQNWDYPQGATTYATPENIDAAKAAWQDSTAFGGNNGKDTIAAAIAQRPDTIVLVTGKGDDLPPSWVTDVMALRANSGIRFDTINSSGNPSAVLKDLATRTGGTYAEFVPPSQK
jgi:hypothetical protein